MSGLFDPPYSVEVHIEYSAGYTVFFWKDRSNDSWVIREAVEKRFNLQTSIGLRNDSPVNDNPRRIELYLDVPFYRDSIHPLSSLVWSRRRSAEKAVENSIFIYAGNTRLFHFKADILSTVRDVESYLRGSKEYSLFFKNQAQLMYKNVYLPKNIDLIDLVLDSLAEKDKASFSIRFDIDDSTGSVLVPHAHGIVNVCPIEILSPQQIAEKKKHINEVYNIPASEQLLYRVLLDYEDNTDPKQSEFLNCQIKLICHYTEDMATQVSYRQLNIPMLKLINIVDYETGELLLTIDFKYEDTLDICEIIYSKLNIN